MTLSPGIGSVDGLPSKDTFTSSFSTVPQQTIVPNIGLIYQTQNFTCNVTSTRMILASRGYNVSDAEVISQMGHETRNYNCSANGGPCYWGNPHENYIGNPNGHGAGSLQAGSHPGKGYGVYWEPVMQV